MNEQPIEAVDAVPVAIVAELIVDEEDDDSDAEQQQQQQIVGDTNNLQVVVGVPRNEGQVLLHNNGDDINDDDDDDNDVLFHDFFDHDMNEVPVNGRFARLRGRNVASISSYLFDLVKEDCTCRSILSGWSRREEGCNRVVDHCSQHPEEAFYVGHYGRSALHQACLRGSCSHIIKSLLTANSAGAMERDHRGNTPLHLLFVDFSTRSIIDPQDIEVIVSLLLNVSPQNMAAAANLEGSTPLHIACTTPETIITPNSLRQLIAANPFCAARLNSRNQTPLRLHCQRLNASVRVAQILLDANPDAMSILDGEDGWAPIHYAAANTNLDLIRFLVEAKPEAACIRTTSGHTPLHLLCRQNPTQDQLPAIDILLSADPTSLTHRDLSNAFTPLHLLCQGSRISAQVLRYLLDANPNVASILDSENYLPLHYACEIGADAEIVSILLQHYTPAAKAYTRKLDSALSLACACNKSVETVRLLIQANSEAMVNQNDYGFAPLHCVCRAYQPRMAIVKALLDACPSAISLKTHAGETPVHLACSNSGAFVGVIQLLTMAQNQKTGTTGDNNLILPNKSITNKIGNTPLHDACFRGSPFEHIETLAIANPEWILVRNNGGYTALQILCKNGRIDERIITTFSRIGGPETFSVVDSSGNTPLHSAMRKDIDLGTVKCLIRAFPDALHSTTIYGDTPMHLACFRRANPEVVQEVALAGSSGQSSPVLVRNTASQTPIGIAMDEFRSICRGGGFCCVNSHYHPEQKRAFSVLETLVKILYHGPGYQDYKQLSLVRACVALHRQNIRLDPAFIRRAIHVYPEETRVLDEEGNLPLHIESSIPIEKMALLDARSGCCHGQCHKRFGILRMLLEIYPQGTQFRNASGHFPLGLMLQNGRLWGDEVALALRAFPPALHWHKNIDDKVLPLILEKASKECGADTLFSLLASRPDIFRRRPNNDKKQNTTGLF